MIEHLFENFLVQMEIKRCLQREGYGSDPAAFKAVSAWSAEKFTSFRNQLRRKVCFQPFKII